MSSNIKELKSLIESYGKLEDLNQQNGQINQDLVDIASKTKLDPEMCSRLFESWALPNSFLFEDNKIQQFNSIREAHKAGRLDSPEGVADVFYKSVFRGVNPTLQFPYILIPLQIEPDPEEFTCTTIPVIYCESKHAIRLNAKNLMRYYKYTETDAKNFMSNLADSPNVRRGFILTNPSKVIFGRAAHVIQSDNVLYSWHYTRDLRSLIKVHNALFSNDHENVLKYLQLGIPSFPLSEWKDMAQERYERITQKSWKELNSRDKQRHLCNFIRHHAWGYDSSWALSPNIHDQIFEKITAMIASQYEDLFEECQNQLSRRNLSMLPPNNTLKTTM
ncbi:hypothetical protein L1D19_21705 [Vibrio natriegens]|uniref:hypothetical protein n=1 Tax=Vibrio natriegens TaxID=691 RepID=UPI001EFE2001|nr:hypothetical protein [Vibrio natriegens]MCG9702687.1 hypothetical protein [Vibrio natriegens]